MKPRIGTEANAGKTARSWTGQITSARDARHTVFHRRVHPGPDSRHAPADGSRTYDATRSSMVQLCDHTDPASTAGVQTEDSMCPAHPAQAASRTASRESPAGERRVKYPARQLDGSGLGLCISDDRNGQGVVIHTHRVETKGRQGGTGTNGRAGRYSHARLERAAFGAMCHASPTLQRDTRLGSAYTQIASMISTRVRTDPI